MKQHQYIKNTRMERSDKKKSFKSQQEPLLLNESAILKSPFFFRKRVSFLEKEKYLYISRIHFYPFFFIRKETHKTVK